MAEIKQTKRAATILKETVDCCKEYRHEFIMPEHLLMVLIDEFSFGHIFNNYADLQTLAEKLEEKLEETEVVPEDQTCDPEVSALMSQVIDIAYAQVINSSAEALDIPHLVMGILQLKESWACYLLKDALGSKESNFMSELISAYEFSDHLEEETGEHQHEAAWRRLVEEGYDLQEIAVKLVDNYIKQIVDDAFFQADPHPGNIRIHDGKIGWIDLGMMGTLSRRDCELFREAISAVAAKNISAIKTVVLSLGDHTGKIDHTRLYADLSDLMDEYGSVNIGEMSLSEFLQDLLHICNVNHIQMPQGVTMLVRGVMTIESVVAKLDPSASIVSVMQQHILEPSLQDLDLRVTAKKLTRSLISAGTHTLDLPENLNNLSKEALKGHSKFNLEIVGSEEPIKQLGKMVNRLVLAVITAALLLSSSFLAITDMKPQILGIPALAFFGYLGALILGGGTLYSVYRSWRKKKKRRPFFFPK